MFIKDNTAAQHKNPRSLSPDQKAQLYSRDAAEHKKHQESLSPKQKAQIKSIDTAAHKKQ